MRYEMMRYGTLWMYDKLLSKVFVKTDINTSLKVNFKLYMQNVILNAPGLLGG